MAKGRKGPDYYQRAVDAYEKLEHEPNEGERARLRETAQLNLSFALFSLIAEQNLDEKTLHTWRTLGGFNPLNG